MSSGPPPLQLNFLCRSWFFWPINLKSLPVHVQYSFSKYFFQYCFWSWFANSAMHKIRLRYCLRCQAVITIYIPLFKKLWDITFFAGQSLYEPFQGTFWGGQDFFDPQNVPREGVKKVLAPSKCPLKWLIKWLSRKKKIRSQSFLNSGTLVILCIWVLLCTVVVCCCLLLGVLVCWCVTGVSFL